MYDVDYETKDYGNAIKRLKINPFDAKFKEDLTSLYMSTNLTKHWASMNSMNRLESQKKGIL
jgi:hypothetical protein